MGNLCLPTIKSSIPISPQINYQLRRSTANALDILIPIVGNYVIFEQQGNISDKHLIKSYLNPAIIFLTEMVSHDDLCGYPRNLTTLILAYLVNFDYYYDHTHLFFNKLNELICVLNQYNTDPNWPIANQKFD